MGECDTQAISDQDCFIDNIQFLLCHGNCVKYNIEEWTGSDWDVLIIIIYFVHI